MRLLSLQATRWTVHRPNDVHPAAAAVLHRYSDPFRQFCNFFFFPQNDFSFVCAQKDGESEENRDKWGNSIEFLLSCISMSVGLGNIWRFPFVAYDNGGGAFLIPYLIILVLIGRPLYFLEMVLGQFSSKGSVKLWSVVPLGRGKFKLLKRMRNFSH